MKLVELEEAKLYISYDSDVMDIEIIRQINAIEGYLVNGTGVDWSEVEDEASKQVAKDYVLFRLRCDYYNEYTEMNIWRLQSMINQLKIAAHMV